MVVWLVVGGLAYGFDDACSWLVVGGLARESTDQLMIMDMMVMGLMMHVVGSWLVVWLVRGLASC